LTIAAPRSEAALALVILLLFGGEPASGRLSLLLHQDKAHPRSLQKLNSDTEHQARAERLKALKLFTNKICWAQEGTPGREDCQKIN